jgi:hypothetical protein
MDEIHKPVSKFEYAKDFLKQMVVVSKHDRDGYDEE